VPLEKARERVTYPSDRRLLAQVGAAGASDLAT